MKKLFVTCIAVAIAGISVAASMPSGKIPFGEAVQLQSKQEFAEDGAWTISAVALYDELSADYPSTNDFGVIDTVHTYSYGLAHYELRKELLDYINGFKVLTDPVYTWTPITSNIVLTIEGNKVRSNVEGSALIVGDDGYNIVSKVLSFNNYSTGKTTSIYTGDANPWVNKLYTEWYGYLANRQCSDTNDWRLINSGYNACQGYVAKNDFVYSNKDFRYYIGTAYNSELYVPIKCVAFRMLSTGNAIRNSGCAVGSRVSINCFHYGDVAASEYTKCNYTHKWMRPDGSSGTCHSSKASALWKWAESKGIYTEEEIRGVQDALAYIYDEGQEVPVECQASILRATIRGDVENDAPNATNCIAITKSPGFTITQHGTLQPQYFSGAIGMNETTSYCSTGCNGTAYRHDDTGIDEIKPYHTAHVCDSGRPWFWIFNGEPIFQGTYHYVSGAHSYAMGWRIIRDFCLENGSTCNLYDMINEQKIVVTPNAD